MPGRVTEILLPTIHDNVLVWVNLEPKHCHYGAGQMRRRSWVFLSQIYRIMTWMWPCRLKSRRAAKTVWSEFSCCHETAAHPHITPGEQNWTSDDSSNYVEFFIDVVPLEERRWRWCCPTRSMASKSLPDTVVCTCHDQDPARRYAAQCRRQHCCLIRTLTNRLDVSANLKYLALVS